MEEDINNLPIKIEIYRDNAVIIEPKITDVGKKIYKNVVKTVKLDSLIKAFSETELDIVSPILPPNCIRFREKGNSTVITLLHEEKRFTATVSGIRYENCVRPNMLMVFHLSKDSTNNYSIRNSQAFGIKDNPAMISEATVLYGLPFPNIGADGWICWGNNSVAGSFKSLVGLRAYCDRLFAAPFNNHLFNSYGLGVHGISNEHDLFKAIQDKPAFNYDLFENIGQRKTIGDL
jgi:hypothetical protein